MREEVALKINLPESRVQVIYLFGRILLLMVYHCEYGCIISLELV